jgi:polyisoprenoid-binding protein YceI
MNIASAAWILAGISVALPAVAAEEVYVIDPVHSQPQWEAHHIGFSDQRGSFAKMEGKVVLDRAAKKGSVDVTIDAASIRSYDTRLDAVLKGERFFNVEKFPTITFKSSDVRFDGDRIVAINGELSMLGVTKPVMLTMTHFACGQNPFNKKPMCGGTAKTTIKRSEWGITNGLPIRNPDDDIDLMLPVEALLQQPQS